MQFGGHYRLAAPRAAVWAALNDTTVLQKTIPGCRRIVWTGPDALELDIEVNLRLFKPVFAGELTLSNVDAAQSYTLSGRGKGGMLGLAHGSADIVLSDLGGGTSLAFAAHGAASDGIMKLGKALLGKSAQHIIDRFFERFADAMGAELTVLPPRDAA